MNKSFYNFSIVACARWENQYIHEWIQYHLSIGFEHIYLYCNDDDPNDLYQKILPFIQKSNNKITFNHFSHIGLQRQMYFHFLKNYSQETKWFIFLDIDEFICLKNINHIKKFVLNFPTDVKAIYFNWCLYGNNGYESPPEGDVLINYTKREPFVNPHTKVLIQSKSIPYKQIFHNQHTPFWHWYLPFNTSIESYTAIKRIIPANYAQNFPENAVNYLNVCNMKEYITTIAYIAHFQFKSQQSFKMKNIRSCTGDFKNTIDFILMNENQKNIYNQITNMVEDRYLYNYWKKYKKNIMTI